MAQKKYYIGSTGPFIYDDTKVIDHDDAEAQFSGLPHRPLVSDTQPLISVAPTQDDEVLRYQDQASGIGLPVILKTGDYIAIPGDYYIIVDTTSGDVTITLPTAVGNSGTTFFIKKISSDINSIIVDGNGTETVDGDLTKSFNGQWSTMRVFSDGSNFLIS